MGFFDKNKWLFCIFFVHLDFQTRSVLRKSRQAANLVEKIEGFVQIIFMKLIDDPINHFTYSLIGGLKFGVQKVV